MPQFSDFFKCFVFPVPQLDKFLFPIGEVHFHRDPRRSGWKFGGHIFWQKITFTNAERLSKLFSVPLTADALLVPVAVNV